MPDSKKRLKENQLIIEERFRLLLKNMAELSAFWRSLRKSRVMQNYKFIFEKSQAYARNHQENNLLRQNQYYETYGFSMRRAQINVIQDMQENLKLISRTQCLIATIFMAC